MGHVMALSRANGHVLCLQRDPGLRQEAEQNSIMGKLDEGLDDFFCKKVVKLSFR